MADIAQLGIEITPKGVDETTKKLGDLSGAAKRAQAAAQGLEAANKGAAGMAANAAKAYAAANDNASRLAGGSKNASTQLRMMALQLSQVAQQAQAGGGILRALAIQLPDLALGFGPIGIAAGVAAGAVLSYFASVVDRSGEAAAALKQQAELIQRVADRWGQAYPALKAYADQLERARNASELEAAQVAASSAKFQELLTTLESLAKRAPEISASLRDITSPEGVAAAQRYLNAMTDIRAALTAGKDPSDALAAATSALAIMMGETGSATVRDYAEQFEVLANRIRAASQESQAFRMQLPALGTLGDMWAEGGKFFNSEQFEVPNPPTPVRRPLIELEGLPRVRGAGRTATNDNYKSSLLSIQERTKAIQAETAAQATLNPFVSDYDFALSKARTSADLLAAAEKAKKAMTPELIAQIDQTSTALANATAAQNRQNEAIQKARQAMEFVKSTTAGFINDLRNGLRDGEGFWKSFGNAALNVLDRITDKLLSDVLDAVFKVGSASGGSAGGGGFLSSILGGIGGIFGFGGVGAFPAAPVGLYAAGGLIQGPGTGTSDSILARVSAGEYIVNAASARKYGGLLEMINNAPGFAEGGAIGRLPQGEAGPEMVMQRRKPANDDRGAAEPERIAA